MRSDRWFELYLLDSIHITLKVGMQSITSNHSHLRRPGINVNLLLTDFVEAQVSIKSITLINNGNVILNVVQILQFTERSNT